ncbi:hypothetical protein [Kordiimonas sp. SCSIO 12610]|uniref:hypothetical protein n=1 Tax=Kordiimonas sp. SCSIO 12610 TaxID=2829597 RepID=UPI002108EA04|nr:hypothetical protein [Kordiimonas sp. SCSIO 12610]UTW56385.1 hypothetical protein KFF44_05635 [Kordiimonas sp. SCSIO 12610]
MMYYFLAKLQTITVIILVTFFLGSNYNGAIAESSVSLSKSVIYSKKLSQRVQSLNIKENHRRLRYKKLPFLDHEIFNNVERFELSRIIDLLIKHNLKNRSINRTKYLVEIKKIKIDGYPVAFFSNDIGHYRNDTFYVIPHSNNRSHLIANLKIFSSENTVIYDKDLNITLGNFDKEDYEEFGYETKTKSDVKMLSVYLANKVGHTISEMQ